MALSHTLLGLLSNKPMTGYQIKQLFESSINHFWNAHVSQIYRELTRMEEEGWVTHCIEPQEGKPDLAYELRRYIRKQREQLETYGKVGEGIQKEQEE